jgi:hypothetical protein
MISALARQRRRLEHPCMASLMVIAPMMSDEQAGSIWG